MMWKIVLLTFLAAGLLSGAKCELKTKTRQRIRLSMQAECDRYSAGEKADMAMEATMRGVECIYNVLELDTSNSTMKVLRATSKEGYVDGVRGICKIRVSLRKCVHDLLLGMAPCASTSVQTQIEDLKKAITELFNFFCNDDCKNIRDFLDDGGHECIEEHNTAMNKCADKVADLFKEIPEDTTTNEAFDACHRFDEMSVCILNILDTCPRPSTKEFAQNLLSMIRKGTYCHVTIPLPDKPSTHEEDNLLQE